MEKKESKRMIDLTSVKVKEIDGQVSTIDMSKDISRNLYGQAQSLEVVTGCLDLFKTGKCEHSEEMVSAITMLLDAMQTGYVMRSAILEAIG